MGSADRRLVGSIFVAISSAGFIGGFPISPWCLRRVVVTISADLLPLLRLFRGDTGKLAKLLTVGRGVPRIKTFFAALRKGAANHDQLTRIQERISQQSTALLS